MTSIAAHERALLCALAQQLGPDAPTLCDGWKVRDLVVHLLVREGSPAAVGLVVPPLSGLVDRASERRSAQDFAELVKQLRHGPPLYSPYALPKLGALLNNLEFFIHHEDIRRAQRSWEARTQPTSTEDGLWRSVRMPARGLLRRSPVGVVAERSDTGARAVLKGGEPQVVVRGLPSEIALYVFGRKTQALVELLGDVDDIASLERTPMGF